MSSMQGWRSDMEDSHCIQIDLQEDVHVFGIFDGHCGKQVAQFCGQEFHKILQNLKTFKQKQYHRALYEAMLETDSQLQKNGKQLLRQFIDIDDGKNKKHNQKLLEDDNLAEWMGCTAIVLLLTKNKYYVANVGDSKAVLYTKDKQIIQLTKSHKPNKALEKQRIVLAGGKVFKNRINSNLNVSRSIGDLNHKKNHDLSLDQQLIIANPDIIEKQYTGQEEYFLVGCDGLWEKNKKEKIFKILTKDQDQNLQDKLNKLLDKSIAKHPNQKKGCDNITAILIKLKNNQLNF